MIRALWRNLWFPLLATALVVVATWLTLWMTLCCWSAPVLLEKTTWVGTWIMEDATGGSYQGKLSASVIKEQGKDKWSAGLTMEYRGRSYFYPVTFSGKPDRLKGKASVLMMTFAASGQMKGDTFSGTFISQDYSGTFSLKEKP